MLRMKAATERPKGWSKWMGKWHKAFLPTWVISLKRTSVCWAADHREYAITAQGYTWSQSSSYSGGCACCAQDWQDPPQAPPADYPSEEQLGGAYSFSWIIAKKLDKQIKNDRPPYNRIIENPESGYGYYTKAEPACGFSGDKGEPKCTHALNHYV